ncbi:MAG: chemotaxis protein CheX [Myxococcales bacterium]|nr:chemotaxis protein CheX [Myxococcales bacterium]
MLIKKYVLIVDAPGGEIARGAGELKALGYEVAQANGFAAAIQAVRRLDRLSLVVVNCEDVPSGYESFMASVRALHPNLPVLLLGDARAVVAKFLKQPGAAEAESTMELLKNDATKLLREEFYRTDLVLEVTDAAHRVLREFGVETLRSEPYIKSNLTSLGEVNALLGFSGEGLAGHLILTASVENALTLHKKYIPGHESPEYDDLEDLLGEIANRVLGGIKRVFESRALHFKVRTPVFIRGPEASYRSKGAAPTLAIEFSDTDGLLRLEFCADRMASARIAPIEAKFLEAGEITFL